jgi:hypothetical protein
MPRIFAATSATALRRVAIVAALAVSACSGDRLAEPTRPDLSTTDAGPRLVARPDIARPTLAPTNGAAIAPVTETPEVPSNDAAVAAASPGLLWHLTGTGSLGVWTWRSGAPGTQAADWRGYGISSGWAVVATADYNADGVDDWVVQQTGTTNFGVYVAPPASGWTAFSASAGWTVIDAADFDADGTPDLLWRGPADPGVGLGGIWLMNGTAPKPASTGWKSLNVSAGWHPDAAADFDGDAKPDVVWHQTGTGNYGLWAMSGTAPAALPAAWHSFAVSTGWEVFDAADMDGSGSPDLLFRDGSGNTGIWKTSGWSLVSIASGGWMSVGGSAGWRVVAAVGGGTTASVANLVIDRVTLTQSVQRFHNSIPLVAGGNGVIVNVFATTSQSLGDARPVVRVRFMKGGVVIAEDSRAATDSLTAAVNASVPNHQVFFPATVLQAGVSVVAEVDPANVRGESSRTDNVYPRGGATMAVDLRSVPPLVVRFVPLQFTGGRTPSIASADATGYLRAAREMWPLGAVSTEIGAPLTIAAAGDPGNADWWSSALAELEARRVAESSSAHYYGVVLPAVGGQTAYGGYAYINSAYAGSWRSAIGLDATWAHWAPRFGTETFAHEIGHNFGRDHAPCGTAGAPDPAFPHAGGVIGVVGYDVYALSAGLTTAIQSKPATSTDLMGYCDAKWVSDYSYLAVLNFRGAPVASALLAARALSSEPTDVLLVSGVAGARRATLNPVYALRARPAAPTAGGAWRVEGLDADGSVVFAYPFAPPRIDHDQPGPFAFALPVDAETQRRLAVVRLVGPGGTVERGTLGLPAVRSAPPAGPAVRQRRLDARRVELRWDPARWPGTLVRGADGEVLGFGAGGSMVVHGAQGELTVLLSDGVHTETHRVTVSP